MKIKTTISSITRYKVLNVLAVVGVVAYVLFLNALAVMAGREFVIEREFDRLIAPLKRALLNHFVRCNVLCWAKKTGSKLRKQGVKIRILPFHIVFEIKEHGKPCFYDSESRTLFIYQMPYREEGKAFAYVWTLMWNNVFPEIKEEFMKIAPELYNEIAWVFASNYLRLTSIEKSELFSIWKNHFGVPIESGMATLMYDNRILCCFVHCFSKLKREYAGLQEQIEEIIRIMNNQLNPRTENKWNFDERRRILVVNAGNPARISWQNRKYGKDMSKTSHAKYINLGIKQKIETIFIISFGDDLPIQFGRLLANHFKGNCEFRTPKSLTRKDGKKIFIARLDF